MRILSLSLLAVLFMTVNAQDKLTFIKAGKLFDGKTRTLRENVVITVEGATIKDVQEKALIPPGANVIDLSDMTVMPGLIDTHTHVVLHPGDYDAQSLRETPEYRAIHSVVNARATLEAGVTTIRDLGNEGAGFADIALRDAVAKGIVPGPRILAAIQPITATGAYGLVGYSPYVFTPQLSYEADGPSEIRKQVRRLVKLGADVIKLYMEAYEKRPLSADSLSGAMTYAPEEVKVLVEEARRSHVKVAAHAYSDEAARIAIEAGVHSIEHGLYISEATFRLMASMDVAYVPTLLVYELWRDGKIFGPISPENKIKLTNTVEKHTASFKRALKTPVKIVFGTDTFELPGTNAQELELMVKYGMSPVDALLSATSRAATLLGVETITGSIEKGKAADIIAFSGNPLEDIRVVQHVAFVMREGNVVRR